MTLLSLRISNWFTKLLLDDNKGAQFLRAVGEHETPDDVSEEVSMSLQGSQDDWRTRTNVQQQFDSRQHKQKLPCLKLGSRYSCEPDILSSVDIAFCMTPYRCLSINLPTLWLTKCTEIFFIINIYLSVRLICHFCVALYINTKVRPSTGHETLALDGVGGQLQAPEKGRALVPVWTGAENLVPTGIRFLDWPVRS